MLDPYYRIALKKGKDSKYEISFKVYIILYYYRYQMYMVYFNLK